MAWIDGDLVNIPITWTHIEVEVPINEEGRELTSVYIELISQGDEGTKSYFDNVELLFDLSESNLSSGTHWPIDLPETTGDLELAIFGLPMDADIIDCYIIPKSDITGDDINYMTLSLVRKPDNAIICSKSFIDDVDADAYVIKQFSTPGDNGQLNTNQGIAFTKINTAAGMTLPQCVLVIVWKPA